MSANGKIGKGTTIGVGTAPAATATTWVNMAEVVDIEGPNESADDIDVTSQSSTGRAKDYIPGLIDSGEVKVSCIYTDEAYEDASEIHATTKAFKITTPFGNSLKFDGYVKEISPTFPLADKMAFDITIKVSGAVTKTPAA